MLDNPDFKEDSVREEIIAPILKRLGYQPSGRTRVQRSKHLIHPFVLIGTRQHPVKIVPDYTLWHDDKALLTLDAKNPSEDVLGRRHVEQAYSYAIHPEVRCKHYALCNGKLLAVFHIEEIKPLGVISLDNCDANWAEVEKLLAPQYLLNPRRRRFQPDMGLAVMKLGMSPETQFVFPACRIQSIGRVSDELYTASAACDFGSGPHLASFDFAPEFLEPILTCLAWPLARQLRSALSRAPYHAQADLMLEIHWATRLGTLTTSAADAFVPFIVTEVLASRFNREPLEDEPNDIPEEEFRLRREFERLQSGAWDSALKALDKS